MTKTKENASSLLDEEDIEIPESAGPIAEVAKPENVQGAQAIIDRRGKKVAQIEKLRSSLGLSRKFQPPITRRQSAVFSVCINRKDPRLQGQDALMQYDPVPYELSPTYLFTDTDEPDLMKREKTMTYYEGGSESVTHIDQGTGLKTQVVRPKIGNPTFEGGQIVVNTINQYGKFAWLSLHPRNKSNKWRDRAKEPIFERVDIIAASPFAANLKEDLKIDAILYVKSLKPAQLMQLAAAMTNPVINPNQDPQTLRLVLRQRAGERPEDILFKDKIGLASTKIACIHALEMGILQYDISTESYFLGTDTEPVFMVPSGNDPLNTLCEFLTSNKGEEAHNIIREQLDFFWD